MDLYGLRERDLGELAPVLAPFIRAYTWDHYRIVAEKTYDRRVRVRELIEEGAEVIVKEGSFVEDFNELYFSQHGFYPEDNPSLHSECNG